MVTEEAEVAPFARPQIAIFPSLTHPVIVHHLHLRANRQITIVVLLVAALVQVVEVAAEGVVVVAAAAAAALVVAVEVPVATRILIQNVRGDGKSSGTQRLQLSKHNSDSGSNTLLQWVAAAEQREAARLRQSARQVPRPLPRRPYRRFQM